jgi:hypothetical protein
MLLDLGFCGLACVAQALLLNSRLRPAAPANDNDEAAPTNDSSPAFQPVWWIQASLAAVVVGGAVGWTLYVILGDTMGEVANWTTLGVVLGLAQAWVVRRVVAGAAWWVVANGVGTTGGWFLSGTLGLWGGPRNLVGLVIYAALTGAVMVWLVGRASPTLPPDDGR